MTMYAIVSAALKDRNGTIAVIFGVTLMVLLSGIGVALDYTLAVNHRTRLQHATDFSAVVAAKALIEGKSWDEATKAAEQTFSENTVGLAHAHVEFERRGDVKDVTVRAHGSADWKQFISKIVRTVDSKIEVDSTASQPHRPVDVVFLVDVSYSMGIGATLEDMIKLKNAIGCAVACHMDGTDAYAQQIGVELRIDVMRKVVRDVIDEAGKFVRPGDKFRFGVTTFSNSIVDNIEPTTDYAEAKEAANRIEMPPNDWNGGTDYHSALAKVALDIQERDKARKDGTQTYVILMTDGVEHNRMLVPGSSRGEVPDPDVPVTTPNHYLSDSSIMMTYAHNLCDAVKATGAQMMVVNIEYVTTELNGYGDPIEKILKPIMNERAKECASDPSYVKNANEPQSINESLKELMLSVSRGRMAITQ